MEEKLNDKEYEQLKKEIIAEVLNKHSQKEEKESCLELSKKSVKNNKKLGRISSKKLGKKV